MRTLATLPFSSIVRMASTLPRSTRALIASRGNVGLSILEHETPCRIAGFGGGAGGASMTVRARRHRLLIDELLAADDADLRQPEPLRRRHDAGDDRVLRRLVRTQMHFGLDGLCSGGRDLLLQRGAIENDLAVPVNTSRGI